MINKVEKTSDIRLLEKRGDCLCVIESSFRDCDKSLVFEQRCSGVFNSWQPVTQKLLLFRIFFQVE